MIIFAIALAVASHYAEFDVALVTSIGICAYYPVIYSAYSAIQPRGYSDYYADLADSKTQEEFGTSSVLFIGAAAYLLIRFW
jgi:hypothetical protein